MLSFFSGIGAFEKALEKLGVEYELIGYSEIDKYASKAYALIHNVPESKNLGDISKIDTSTLNISDLDLLTYGFPCQDISIAGKQEGIVKGKTRSGLLYECEKIIEYCKPKYLLMENVKNLIGKKNKASFDEWLKESFTNPDQLKANKEKHYIPYVDLSFGNFESFLEAREKLIVAALKKELM